MRDKPSPRQFLAADMMASIDAWLCFRLSTDIAFCHFSGWAAITLLRLCSICSAQILRPFKAKLSSYNATPGYLSFEMISPMYTPRFTSSPTSPLRFVIIDRRRRLHVSPILACLIESTGLSLISISPTI